MIYAAREMEATAPDTGEGNEVVEGDTKDKGSEPALDNEDEVRSGEELFSAVAERLMQG